MFHPGVVLGNRYRLDDRIASGGMGDVWRGTDDVLGRTVAVKILLPALLDEPGFADRFRGEARTMATVNHPGVVDIYDYGNDDQVAFLVMEYVDGDALNKTLSRVSRLTPARTMALVAQAAEALHAGHLKGIVHRDVKPGNLMVRPDGSLVVIDFGIARSALVGQLTAAGAVLGTASYISPEQANGSTASPASDVYSLGIVAYQCLAGRRPFQGDNPVEIAMKHAHEPPPAMPGDIPPPVRAIVERAIAKDPAARFPTAAAMAIVARQAALSLAGAAVGRPSGTARPVGGVSSPPRAVGAAGNRPTGTASAPRPTGTASAPRTAPPLTAPSGVRPGGYSGAAAAQARPGTTHSGVSAANNGARPLPNVGPYGQGPVPPQAGRAQTSAGFGGQPGQPTNRAGHPQAWQAHPPAARPMPAPPPQRAGRGRVFWILLAVLALLLLFAAMAATNTLPPLWRALDQQAQGIVGAYRTTEGWRTT